MSLFKTQAEDNLDRLVEARERFDELMAQVQATPAVELTTATVRTLAQLGRALGVSDAELLAAFRVTP